VATVVRLGDWELVLRLGLTVGLCSLIGLERSSRDEVAGLRTHALVGLGAGLFTLVSAYGFAEFATAAGPRPDPTRIAAQIARTELGPVAQRVHLDLRVPTRLAFTTILAELAALEDVAAVNCSGMHP
jgi:hypothetical protein